VSAANKALIQQYVEAWNTWNFAVMDKIVAPDFSVHAFGRAEVKGLEALKQLATVSRATFPDGRFTVESIIAEGDLVAIHWSWHGTHQGEYLGIAATGKQVTETGTSFYRIAGSTIAEMWGDENTLGLLQQLGVVPDFG
jgi:steroid delta-isomerase-like uncharacterized protein